MKDFIIFTQGTYSRSHLDFYRRLSRSKVRIAVNGGMSFFRKVNVAPHLLIGDFDSLKKAPSELLTRTKVLTFPQRKDKTDLQLAFEYCLSEQAVAMDVVIPSYGQPDHFLGNLMLVNLLNDGKHTKKIPRVRFVNVRYEILYMRNNTEVLVNCIGDIVSVVPMSRLVRLTCTGTEYDIRNAGIHRGQTWGLRNRIASRRATFDIRGQAFVIHQFHL